MFRSLLTSLLVITDKLPIQAQRQTFREYMSSHGKIYIVIAVTAIIIIGLAVCIFFMDRKLRRAIKR